MTVWVQIHEGAERQALTPEGWKPWIKSATAEETVMLAAHQHIRFRGGVLEPFTMMVYSVPEAEWNDGKPISCHATRFDCKPTTKDDHYGRPCFRRPA